MPSLSESRTINAAYLPSYTPVGIFVGGTAGIGKAMAEAFARYTKGNSHIIIVGRNRAAAESIIASFPKPTSPSVPKPEFVECDATLMKNVDVTTKNLLARLTKVNFLVLSPGFLTIRGRDETEEGLDKKMALNYYARWKFTNDLMPLLRKAKDAGEDAGVFSVLAAGGGGKIDLKDLGLKNTYGVVNASLAAATYNDLMIEQFASKQPDIAFTHVYPGIVTTSILQPSHWALKPLYPVLTGLLYPFSVTPEVCAEYMLSALFSGHKGSYRRGAHGEDIGMTKYYGSDEARKLLWEHTVEVTKV